MRSAALLTTSFLLISIISTVRGGENFDTPGVSVNSSTFKLQDEPVTAKKRKEQRARTNKKTRQAALESKLALTGQDGVKEFILTPDLSPSEYYKFLALEKEKGPLTYLVGQDYRSAPPVRALGLCNHNLSEVSTKDGALAKLNLLRSIYEVHPEDITFSRTYDINNPHLQKFEPVFGEHCKMHKHLLDELLSTEQTYKRQLTRCRDLLMKAASKMQVVLDPSLLAIFESIIFQVEKLIENSDNLLTYIQDLTKANDENEIAASEEAMISLVKENLSGKLVL